MKWPSNPLADIVRNIVWPIKVVRVSIPATPTPNTGMVWVGYDMATQSTREILKGLSGQVWSTLPDTYHHLLACPTPEELQDWVSELGWRLGAGYMYRWSHAPGRPMKHLWGMERLVVIDEPLSEGDRNPVLADLCVQYGSWMWEINCAYNRPDKAILANWIKEDPARGPDGSRESDFPGWGGEHPWLQATEPATGYESHFYFVLPERYRPSTDVLVKTLKP